MTHTRIKICGITRIEDARAVESAGCDAIGFVFWNRSPRCIGIEDAAVIAAGISPLLTKVGVFVSPTMDEVLSVTRKVGLDVAQLCGELGTHDWNDVSREVKVLRAIGVKPGGQLRWEDANGFGDVLVDSHTEETPGGTGKPFDWQLLAPQDDVRVWLAGGLNAANVGAAIAQVRPYAVDVSSGVEERPGIKSHAKISQFVAAVRAADQSQQG